MAVIGLGRLGRAMVKTLYSSGHEVLGIDSDEECVQYLSQQLPSVHFATADATDGEALRGLGIGEFDSAAVVIEESIEAAILATANLKRLGVPYVVARALSELHAQVLDMVGADRVIQPEEEMGVQLARSVTSPAIIDYVQLGEDEALIEAEVPEEWDGKTLAELELPRKHGLAVLTLKPQGGSGTIPQGYTVLHEGDVIVIGGRQEHLDRLKFFQPNGSRKRRAK